MLKKIKKQGFTLVEMIIAVSMFSVIIIIIGDIFISIVRMQKSVIMNQEVQEGLRIAYEIMGKEVRNARIGNYICNGGAINRVYNTNGTSTLYFLNKNNECVTYALVENGIQVTRANINDGTSYYAYITPVDVIITELIFVVHDNANLTIPGYNNIHPYVTFSVKAHGKGNGTLEREMILQTSISSRSYL